MSLQQKLETKYLLTPLLKQSLDILKYSMQELEDYVKEVANSNPLIEITQQDIANRTIELARLNHNKTVTDSFVKDHKESFDMISQLASRDQSLEMYLIEQLAMKKDLTATHKEVILYFIRSLNDMGYLECELDVVCKYFQLSLSKCEELLKVLQTFEPVGIGARNLREYLLIQLNSKNDVPKLAYVFVEQHLEDLAKRKFQYLSIKYQISKEEVQEIFSYIQSLQPYPFIESEGSKTEYIIPDIIIEKIQGEYIIRINDAFLPQVSINTYYEELLRTNNELQNYYNEKLSDAILLIKGIEQRHETLYKVTKIIINNQKEFLEKGKTSLRPLRLKDVSNVLEIHESTVSRAISKKYIQTPQGIYPIKDLFTRGLKTSDGTVESTVLIKEKIKGIIQNEDPKQPFSDQLIANVLLSEGIQIARRTVAKYREELGILKSTKRKEKH